MLAKEDATSLYTQTALKIAGEIYGGVEENTPQWENCMNAARRLHEDGIGISLPAPPVDLRPYFNICNEFNKRFPVGTSGTLKMGLSAEHPCRVEQAALVWPRMPNGVVVVAWFSGVGWFDVQGFTFVQQPVDIAKEITVQAQNCRKNGHTELARHLLEAALRHDPEYYHALNELGVLLASIKDHTGAVLKYTAALKVVPGAAEIINNRASSYRALGHSQLALQDTRAATALQPENETLLLNLSTVLSDIGETEEAVRILEARIAKKPDSYDSQYNRALTLLSDGRFILAWPHFVWRLKQPAVNTHYEHFPVRRWNGEPIRDKSVLIWTEQGIGDEIMTASMIPDAIADGAKVTLLCAPRLVSLFKRSFPEITVDQRTITGTIDVFRREPLRPEFLAKAVREGKFDCQMSQGDLGHMYRPHIDGFPRHDGFLKADPIRTAKYRDYLASTAGGNKLVGISWHSKKNERIGDLKSLDIKEMLPILRTPGVTFVNLQYGDCSEDLAMIERETGVIVRNFPGVDALADMDKFASLVSAMDLVITASNTTAHVAGGLGVPTWVMTPEGPGRLWYWFRKGMDSPWYPSVSLYRQKRAMDWNSVILDIGVQLQGWAE